MDIKAVIDALGITKEDVIERAAQIAADEASYDDEGIHNVARNLIAEKVDNATNGKIDKVINETLNAEMERLLVHEYTPVDIWGDATGKPTTLRTTLHEKAKGFWVTKVNQNGEPCSYSGTPRYEWLFQKTVGSEFRKAVEQNITNIVGGLKDALRENASEQIEEHINKLIKVATASDKRR